MTAPPDEAWWQRASSSDVWWKHAVIYCLDVKTFSDGDGDGTGDFVGLVDRLEYLRELGVNCIWLMPFHPSPQLDDGYDVIDHYGVHPKLGSFGDLVVFLRAAREYGLRVIMDLVVNHTSDRHPWFRAARRSRTSPFRDYYVWRDEPSNGPESLPVFPGDEESIWTLDERTGQYYLHHFYAHQPDLNFGHPAVRQEIKKIMGFWLELGVDGFRVDAVPFVLDHDHLCGGHEVDPHQTLKELRMFVSRRRGDALLLGEVALPDDELPSYFGDPPGDQLQMLFQFRLMAACHLAFARCEATPVAEALQSLTPAPAEGQWATFLRNHDELTLHLLTDAEREEVFRAFAPDDDMRLYGRGIRRRLPTMLGGDPERLRMAYSLLLSLPGTPVLFYGEELGMGENLDVPGRASVRTPMQWDDTHNGGFSSARRSKLVRPLPGGRWSASRINVAEQRREEGSLLRWMQHMITRRRELPELALGRVAVLPGLPPAVLAHRIDGADRSFVAVHNFAPEPQSVCLELGAGVSLAELSEHDVVDKVVRGDDGTFEILVGGYGHRWYVSVA